MGDVVVAVTTAYQTGATSSIYTYDIVVRYTTTAANGVVVGTVFSVVPSQSRPDGVQLIAAGVTLAVVPGAKPQTTEIPLATTSTLSASTTAPTDPQTSPAPSISIVPSPTKSSSAATSTASSQNSNTGQIVGAAIGCLVVGALLGFIIAFIFYRRRSRGPPSYSPPPAIAELGTETKPLPVAELESPAIVDAKLSLNNFLLDASPDKEIAAELRSLGTLIQQHAENNYHLQPLQVDSHALAGSLLQLGVGGAGGLDPEVVAQLALNPRTRQPALQHVISQVLFTSIDVSSRSQLSMLPAPIAAFLQSIPPQGNGEKSNEVLSIALNQWRALAAFILHPARSQRTPLPTSNAAVAPQAAGLADALNNFLGCFVVPGDEHRQKNHLQAVITECTKLGYVLLSQPTEWRFVHNAGAGQRADYGGHSRVLVVCAGLVKASQKDGIPYNAPIQVVAPTTVAI